MKTVSRLTYTFWSLFYHSLCLSGLVWQVTLISINFFRFDVNKDINIRMPSEFNFTVGKSVYLCFEMYQFLDREQFRDLMLVWSKSNETAKRNFVEGLKPPLTPKPPLMPPPPLLHLPPPTPQPLLLPPPPGPPPPPPPPPAPAPVPPFAFRYWATIGEIFQAVLNESIIDEGGIIEIIFENKICFTSNETRLHPIFFGDRFTKRGNRVLDNVTSISVALGDNYPYFDPQSLIMVDNIRNIFELYLRSYSYNIIKKEFPYSDKCYDYRLSKIVNQYEARIKCYEESWGNTFASHHRIISKNDFHLYNLTRSSNVELNCNEQPPDCNRTFHLTSYKVDMRHGNFSDLHIWILPEEEKKDPSFTLVSKPRIDNIDFFSFILGALGSWLGFSFLGINPVPYLLTVASPSNQIQDVNDQRKTCNCIFILSSRVARNETKCYESEQKLKIDFRSKIEQHNQQHNQRFIQHSTVINTHNRIIRKLISEINSLKQNQDV